MATHGIPKWARGSTSRSFFACRFLPTRYRCVRCDIRWPNDLILNERKLAGIMVQAVEKGVLIAGIGVNVNQTVFPEELRSVATSLRIETGREHEKEALLERIVAGSLTYAALLECVGKG